MLRVITALVVVLSAVITANASIVAYEGFAYPAGGDLAGENGGIGWAAPWMDFQSGPSTLVSSPGLTYPGLATIGNAASTPALPSGDVSTYPRLATDPIYGITGTTLYYSMLLRPDAGFGFYGGLNIGDIFFGVSGNQTVYTIEGPGGNIAMSSTPVVQGVDALLVVQANFGTINNTFNLYVDPSLPGGLPATPDAMLVRSATSESNTLYINNPGGWTIDEISIGTTYADVTPVPEPTGFSLFGVVAAAIFGGRLRNRAIQFTARL